MQYPPVLPGPDVNYLIHRVSPFVGLILMFVGVRWLLRSPVGEAFAERVRQRSLGRWGVAGEDPRRGAAGEEARTNVHLAGPLVPLRVLFTAGPPPLPAGGPVWGGALRNPPHDGGGHGE